MILEQLRPPLIALHKDLNPILLLHFITFLVVVFAAPVLEELLFRGILYTPVARRIGVWKAMGLVSVVGSLNHLHATEVQTLWLFAFLFLLCYGYVRSASLYGPIIWHATLNFVVFRPEVATAFAGYVSGQTLDRYYFCGLFLLLLVVNSLWLTMKSKRVKPHNEEEGVRTTLDSNRTHELKDRKRQELEAESGGNRASPT